LNTPHQKSGKKSIKEKSTRNTKHNSTRPKCFRHRPASLAVSWQHFGHGATVVCHGFAQGALKKIMIKRKTIQTLESLVQKLQTFIWNRQ